MAAIASGSAPAPACVAPSTGPAAAVAGLGCGQERVKMTRLRQTVAWRLKEA